ncbi:MAG: Kef family K(+) transporter [Planctomycetes bacterium]|nr:Kef family K(+) transporter [Planctomycetota bacterium]
MPHETALIATLAAGLGLAFLLGLFAVRFEVPPLVGYLMAGMLVGPFTPGFVADAGLASQLAEVGVILLMFGVGLHFAPKDLLAVRRIALPGALGQIAAATLLGAGLARAWGWSWTSSLVFGVCLSIASTVVLLRALEGSKGLQSIEGRIAVGWLVVEDLFAVLVLVLLPLLAPATGAAGGDAAFDWSTFVRELAWTVGKVAAFVGSMVVVGRRVVPWLLVQVARTGSRELFTLCVLAIALGIAFGASALFGVSFALGAFAAGIVVGETEMSHKAASNALPLQEAFGVLFFVAVGMLFDPAILVREPVRVLAVLSIILVGKTVTAFLIVIAFRYPLRVALEVAASLAQIGEFSFIVAALGASLGLLPEEARSLIVAGALISITFNAFLFRTLPSIERRLARSGGLTRLLERPAGALAEVAPEWNGDELRDHVVVVGHGRVGSWIAEELARRGTPYVVVEENREVVERARERGVRVLYGDAADAGVLERAHIRTARLLVLATPDPVQTRVMLEEARSIAPHVATVVRSHTLDDQRDLLRLGAERVVLGEEELARAMMRETRTILESTPHDAGAPATPDARSATLGAE